jgi:hypothetical protein
MSAASHAVARALVAVAALAALLLVVAPPPATAQSADLTCPAVVGDLPLSVTAPFSGTVRHVDGGSSSLTCAYGEGVAPSAELTVTWDEGAACGDATTEVAPSLRTQPFERAGAALVRELGGPCPPASEAGLPVGALAAAGAAALCVVAGVVLVRRRRRRRPAPVATVAPTDPCAEHGATRPVSHKAPALPAAEPLAAPEPAEPRAEHGVDSPVSHKVPAEPVLAALSGPSGRAFARTEAGQWAVVSAVAYASGNPVAGDLARAGALRLLTSDRRPRPELVTLADRLAHPTGGDDR